jgi:hypothetical protein
LEIQIKSKEIEKEYFANGPLGRMALACHSQRAGFFLGWWPICPKNRGGMLQGGTYGGDGWLFPASRW